MYELILNGLSIVGAIELLGHLFGDNKSLTVSLVVQVIDKIVGLFRKA
jgi:hypothetical protein